MIPLPRPRLRVQLGIACILSATSLMAADPPSPEAMLREAVEHAQTPAQYTQAVATCGQILAVPRIPDSLRLRAHEALVTIHARHGARQEAIDAAEALRKAFPEDGTVDRQATFSQADQFAAWSANTNPAPAIARLQAFIRRRPADRPGCAQAWLYRARFESRAKAWDAALQAARLALETDPTNIVIGSESLWMQQEIAAHLHQPDTRLEALQRALGPVYGARLAGYDLIVRRDLLASTLRELRRWDELQRFCAEMERLDDAPDRRQQWCFLGAEACREGGQTNAALSAYERVFTSHPDVTGRWAESQSRIVEVLAGAGRVPEAVQAARVLWEAATDGGSADRAAARLAELLKLADGNSARAEALLAMQRFGPAGKDGLPGSADDPIPVLASLGYPATCTLRRQAFDAVSAALGDNTEAALQRGRACFYAGDPRQGLAFCADAWRRSPASSVPDVARTVLQAVRAVQGHSGGLGSWGAFMAYGPCGPDGQAATADDLQDPFALAGLSGSARQPGGLTPLPVAEAAALHEVIRESCDLVDRPGQASRRAAAILACQRSCEALVLVDVPALLTWVRESLRREPDAQVQLALVRLGQTVAKADRLDLAGISSFDDDVRRLFEEMQQPLPASALDAMRQIERAVEALPGKAPNRAR